MFEGKNILVIGGTGSIGQAAIQKMMAYHPKVVRIFSRDEYKQFVMQENLKGHKNIRFLLGDVRDKERLETAMKGIDLVFHLAALKHVPACEYNPFEAVKTNVIGTQNVIACAIKNKVHKVVYASSDKAASPTNTMGATKLLAERLISSADYSKGGKTPIFSAVRFGNVLGSRGAVIQLWKKQILKQREITVTDPNMTRFMLTVDQAVNLMFKAYEKAKGGETFVLKMPVIRLGDLAQVVVEEVCGAYGINPGEVGIKVIGLRPGEKMYEELMTEDESMYSVEYPEMFAIQPYTRYEYLEVKVPRSYSSDHQKEISQEEIRQLLTNINIKGEWDERE